MQSIIIDLSEKHTMREMNYKQKKDNIFSVTINLLLEIKVITDRKKSSGIKERVTRKAI